MELLRISGSIFVVFIPTRSVHKHLAAPFGPIELGTQTAHPTDCCRIHPPYSSGPTYTQVPTPSPPSPAFFAVDDQGAVHKEDWNCRRVNNVWSDRGNAVEANAELFQQCLHKYSFSTSTNHRERRSFGARGLCTRAVEGQGGDHHRRQTCWLTDAEGPGTSILYFPHRAHGCRVLYRFVFLKRK